MDLTPSEGGASGDGTVFKIAAGTNVLTTLATFTGTANGQYPGSLTLDAGGNLYGATQLGGASGDGTVFKIVEGTNTLSTLATFNDTNGYRPNGGVTLDASGNLYGTTYTGGTSSYGTVFKIATGKNILSTLATFNGNNGLYPEAGLTFDTSGNLYGTTYTGGVNGAGTVFKLTPSGAASAPEPAALALLLPTLALIALCVRQRATRALQK